MVSMGKAFGTLDYSAEEAAWRRDEAIRRAQHAAEA